MQQPKNQPRDNLFSSTVLILDSCFFIRIRTLTPAALDHITSHLSLSLAVSLCFILPLPLSLSDSFCLSLSLSVSLCLSVFLYLSLFLFVSLCLSLCLSFSLCLYVYLSLTLSLNSCKDLANLVVFLSSSVCFSWNFFKCKLY